MTKREYLAMLDKLEKPVRDAYLEYVRRAVGFASVSEVEAFVRSPSVDAILAAAGISQAALSDVSETVRNTYMVGGKVEAPQARIVFDIRHPMAERWLREQSSTLVTRIIEAQREAIREMLESGLVAGRNPRATALDIIGRIGATGRRTGGVIGLTGQQAAYVANAREQLLSGDPLRMAEYFTRQRRDRRFDHIVHKAIAEGRPVSAADVDRMMARYADRLLQLRGETIARTETLAALNAGRDQAWTQAVDEGKVDADLITSTWSATGNDGRTRDTHLAMNNQKRGFGVPFDSPSGAKMMRPGDTSLGAPGSEIINCRCFLQRRADFIGMAARRV